MKGKAKYLALVVIVLALLGGHIGLSAKYRDTMYYEKFYPADQFYVFNEAGYDLLSSGMDDIASRLFLLYAIYTPLNMNIPGTDYGRLTTSLRGISHLDPQNIQPYLTVAYYWSWAKRPEPRRLLTEYTLTGVDRFPENWDIPYTAYRFIRESVPEEELDEESSRLGLQYLQMAADRAVTYGGPKWIVDYPAILMSRDGETLEAGYWLLETLQKTDNPQQVEVILERMQTIMQDLPPEQADLLRQQMQAVIEERG
jgi:hypothetical protein